MAVRKAPESKSRIPEFKSREEEAAWFDTHDMADYQDEFKTVKVRFAKHLTAGLTLRLDHETMAKLEKLARGKRMPPASLVHLWVLEHLAQTGLEDTPTKPQ